MSTKLKDILRALEELAPLALQEDYDNSGLQAGDPEQVVHQALVCLDVTEEIMQEAIGIGADVVIAHHPLIFRGLKRMGESTATERILKLAIRKNMGIVAWHTNLDNVAHGVNGEIAAMLGIEPMGVLEPKREVLRKLATFAPRGEIADKVRAALWKAGAGHIGNYDQCSFNIEGEGTFRPLPGADPYDGTIGKQERAKEEKIEVIYPFWIERKLVEALRQAHPYEEPAFDISTLNNQHKHVGAGMIGKLAEPMGEMDFLARAKAVMGAQVLRHSQLMGRPIEKIAFCGGAGSFLIGRAIAEKADLYLTADLKYHQFFEAEGKIVLADIGHYESEQFTIDLIARSVAEKLPTFAVRKTGLVSNPVFCL